MRLNARIPEGQYRDVEDLARRTGQTVSDVVREALARYLTEHADRPHAARALEDLIGCAEGPEDLSDRYKDALTESLARKHGLR